MDFDAAGGTLRFVRSHSFTAFVVYRVAASLMVLLVIAAGWR